MNIGDMKARLSSQGIARNNRWIATVFPPRGLTTAGAAISDLLGGQVNVNVPGLDLIDSGVDAINQVLEIPNSILNTNFDIPTLGSYLNNTRGNVESLTMFCENAQFPGRDILSSAFRIHGEQREIGIRHQHGDLTISYYCSEDLFERKFFEQWQNVIFNPFTKQHGYYDDYIGSVEISKYNQSWKKETAAYKMSEVYPTNVGVQELTSSQGDLLRLNITFKYYNYERIV